MNAKMLSAVLGFTVSTWAISAHAGMNVSALSAVCKSAVNAEYAKPDDELYMRYKRAFGSASNKKVVVRVNGKGVDTFTAQCVIDTRRGVVLSVDKL